MKSNRQSEGRMTSDVYPYDITTSNVSDEGITVFYDDYYCEMIGKSQPYNQSGSNVGEIPLHKEAILRYKEWERNNVKTHGTGVSEELEMLMANRNLIIAYNNGVGLAAFNHYLKENLFQQYGYVLHDGDGKLTVMYTRRNYLGTQGLTLDNNLFTVLAERDYPGAINMVLSNEVIPGVEARIKAARVVGLTNMRSPLPRDKAVYAAVTVGLEDSFDGRSISGNKEDVL
ncbi:hypothetical protein EGW08_021949 [Elysia chlorotica]|uniref:Uncharacterized protein n=1 Tax=Elysia chlorotica TaxID=188477 RepID=A0A3S0ZA71_ELYCH|nr:hypothetical protein EGW08_021949 [Elysia chlorotica]